MFDIKEFYRKKIAVRCETYEERDEFYSIMQELYPHLMRNWHLPASKKPLEYCYVAGFADRDELLCFTCETSAKRDGYEVITYRDLCSRGWEVSPLSGLLDDVQ